MKESRRCKICSEIFDGDKRQRFCPKHQPSHTNYMREYSKLSHYKKRKNKWHKRWLSLPGNKEKVKIWRRDRHWNVRVQTMAAYGGRCACCGEREVKFLSLHHKHGDGGEHRRKLNVLPGVQFYLKLRRMDYPQNLGLVVLCHNCHAAISKWGKCPHHN